MCIKKLMRNSMDMVHNMNMFDVTIFKLTVFAAAIWITKLLPIVASLNIWIYVAIWEG
jgi:hypothetical protein